MKQSELYKYATWILLFMNLGILAFFFFTKPPHHGKRAHKNKAVDLLKLDKEQHTLFLQFAKQHHQKMKGISENQRMLLKPYFQSIVDTTKIVDKGIILDEFQKLERRKVETTYQHFQEVKSILKEEQYVNFDIFLNNTLEKLLIESKRNRHPPKDF